MVKPSMRFTKQLKNLQKNFEARGGGTFFSSLFLYILNIDALDNLIQSYHNVAVQTYQNVFKLDYDDVQNNFSIQNPHIYIFISTFIKTIGKVGMKNFPSLQTKLKILIT